jgi:hypothetical protein
LGDQQTGGEFVPKKKVLRTIKATPLKGTLKTKDIEKAVAVAKRQRPKADSKPLVRV